MLINLFFRAMSKCDTRGRCTVTCYEEFVKSKSIAGSKISRNILGTTKLIPSVFILEKNNSGPRPTGSASNGNRHRVLPPPGGNVVFLRIHRKSRRKSNQRLVIDRGHPLFKDLWRKPQTNGFHEFILVCYRQIVYS